jgi:hypothetical protein
MYFTQARRQRGIQLENGAVPLHFLAPIGRTSIPEECERVWLLATFVILLLAHRNCVKNNLLKNEVAAAPDGAETIGIEALERAGDTTINR